MQQTHNTNPEACSPAPLSPAGVPHSDELRDLAEYLGRLSATMCASPSEQLQGEARATLMNAAASIRANGDAELDYRLVLERLTGLFARGIRRDEINPCTESAGVYADLVAAISQRFAEYDYSEAIGQLLVYMGRLFQAKRSNWTDVYEHLLAMPQSAGTERLLGGARFAEIREWYESGVSNLFSIQRDVLGRVDALEKEIAALDRRIDSARERLAQRRERVKHLYGSRLVLIEHRWHERAIEELELERVELVDELSNKRDIAELIEEDIREFEVKLERARRLFLLRAI